MDLSFGRNWHRHAVVEPVRLDYPRLIAILAATQAASRTAGIAARLARPECCAAGPIEALVAMFDPAPGRSGAQQILAGRFNPAIAGLRR